MIFKTIPQQINYLAGSRPAANYLNWLFWRDHYTITDRGIIFYDEDAGVETTMTEYSIIAKYKDRKTKVTCFEKLSQQGAALKCLSPDDRRLFYDMGVYGYEQSKKRG